MSALSRRKSRYTESPMLRRLVTAKGTSKTPWALTEREKKSIIRTIKLRPCRKMTKVRARLLPL